MGVRMTVFCNVQVRAEPFANLLTWSGVVSAHVVAKTVAAELPRLRNINPSFVYNIRNY